MSLSANFPTIRPSLALDFASSRSLDPRITFTRASTATYYDDHTVAKAEENLLTYSEQFDNASWSKSEVTITANSVAAPDGNTTAETATPSTNVARHTVQQNYTSVGATYVYSVYAKANGYNRFTIRESQVSGNGSTFDLGTGTVVANQVGGVGAITSVGNGWYRCTMTATETSGTRSMQILVNSNSGSGFESAFAGDGASGIYLWGAQLEQRSSVTAYTPTTTQAITNYVPQLLTAAANVARFEHNPVTRESLGLEIEESRTNLLTYSEQFDNAAWTKNASSITANTVVAPDGTLSADKLVGDTSANIHYVRQLISATAGNYTISVYAKAAEQNVYNQIRLYFVSNATSTNNCYTAFDLVSGSWIGNMTTSGTGYTPVDRSFTAVGNGWYRITFTATVPTESVQARIYQSINNSVSVASDGISGPYIWGAQLEAGSFATSYIPTVASQVTRSADNASMTGTNFSSWYRADEGTMYAETVSQAPASGQNYLSADINAGTRMSMYTNAGAGYWFVRDNSVVQAGISSGSVAAGVPFKMAGAYKINDFSAAAQGSLGTADTSGVVPAVGAGSFFIGSYSLGAQLNGNIKKIAYYPARLTNAQLQALTLS